MLPPGGDQVQRLYQMAQRSIRGRDALKEALRQGDTQRYHRVLRETPEALHADALLATRRQLAALTAERRRLQAEEPANPMRRDLEIEQINEAMAQVAAGTLLFIGGHGGQSP